MRLDSFPLRSSIQHVSQLAGSPPALSSSLISFTNSLCNTSVNVLVAKFISLPFLSFILSLAIQHVRHVPPGSFDTWLHSNAHVLYGT